MRSRLRAAGLTLALVVASGTAGWWAARTAIQPPEPPAAADETLFYTVAEGTVGQTIEVPVSGSWPAAGTLVSASGGVLTERLVDSGALVDAGTAVATIDLEPVVLASGGIPAFRDLTVGAVGKDVEQLQAFLVELGLLDDDQVDGRFQSLTRDAVRAWQRGLGSPPTGAIQTGRLLFVPQLPVRLRWTAVVGERLGDGQALADVLAPMPRFVTEVDRRTFADVPTGGALVIEGASGATWDARLGGVVEQGPDVNVAELVTDDNACDERCDEVGVEGVTRLSGRIVLQEERRGPVIPVSAVTVAPSGRHVVHVDGRGEVTVEVLAEADGQVVVAGLEVGERVELPSPERP